MHQRDAAGAADVDRTIVGSIIPFAETKRLDSFCSTPCLLKDGIAKGCVYVFTLGPASLLVCVQLLRLPQLIALPFFAYPYTRTVRIRLHEHAGF